MRRLTLCRYTLVYDLGQVFVLQRRGNTFLIRQLFVHGHLGGVCTRRYLHGDLKPRRQRSQQLHPYGKTNQRGHRAMGNRWSKVDVHRILFVAYGNEFLLDYVQLLQR